MAHNHDIVGPERISSCSTLGTDLSGMLGSAEVEVQEFDAPEQTLDDVKIATDGP